MAHHCHTEAWNAWPGVTTGLWTCGARAGRTAASNTGSGAGMVCGRNHSAMLILTWQPMFSTLPLLVRCSDFGRTKTKICACSPSFQRCHQQQTSSLSSISFRRSSSLLLAMVPNTELYFT